LKTTDDLASNEPAGHSRFLMLVTAAVVIVPSAAA
jgi:hypothetical protein